MVDENQVSIKLEASTEFKGENVHLHLLCIVVYAYTYIYIYTDMYKYIYGTYIII